MTYPSHPAIHLRLLGIYELVLDGAVIKPPGTAKARSLLSYLALRRDEWIRRETLMGELWPEADTQSARNSLKTALYAIRRTFKDAGADPDAVLVAKRDAVRWIAPTTVDSRDFERRSIDVDDERRTAIAIYSGEFAPGDDNEWAQYTRVRLAMRFEQMLRRELAVRPRADIAERLLLLDPFSDEAYLALIEGSLSSGELRTAQAVYRRYAAALAEIGMKPPSDLATRLGIGANAPRREQVGFTGRSDELAEITYLFGKGVRTIVLSGIAGIGKTALAIEARRFFGDDSIAILDIAFADCDERGSGLMEKLARCRRAIICAPPDVAASIFEFVPDAERIELGPLAYDEVVVALRRRFAHFPPDALNAVWKRTQGYPIVLQSIGALLEDLGTSPTAESIERLRLSRDVERRFETLLREAGSDAVEVAMLLAIEPRLDNDDLVSLLDWSPPRVGDARVRLRALGVAYDYCAEAALRSVSPSRRERLVERIAERLKAHEDPNATLRLARHCLELGRTRDAVEAYLHAAEAFAASSSWEHAGRAVDAGIEIAEPLLPAAYAARFLRELQLLKGRVLYHQGAFIAALRALESTVAHVDDLAQPASRANALVLMGNALVRINMPVPAQALAQQAIDESLREGDVHAELAAQLLLARVLRDRLAYDDTIRVASNGFERSTQAREWWMAAMFANLIIEVSRRRLQFDRCFYWGARQIEAALLAGPLIEAEARHMMGSVKAVVNDLDGALEEMRHALPLIERYPHRKGRSPTPTGQLEWMLHHALAHTYTLSGDFDEAVAESEWLVRSPWTLNSEFSSWQALSVTVDARLAVGTTRDVAAATLLLERVPRPHSEDRRACLYSLAHARVAARTSSPEALGLLRAAFADLSEASAFYGDQIHPYFLRLAESARGIDDALATKCAEVARVHQERVIAAAGTLWSSTAKQLAITSVPPAT